MSSVVTVRPHSQYLRLIEQGTFTTRLLCRFCRGGVAYARDHTVAFTYFLGVTLLNFQVQSNRCNPIGLLHFDYA